MGDNQSQIASRQMSSEPRNPFYFLLLIAGVAFTITALAVAVVPVLEKRWLDEGELPPPSPWRDALLEHGLTWLVVEAVALVVFGLASMGLDRWRRARKERAEAATPAAREPPPL